MRGRESVLLTVIALTTCALLLALTTGCDQGPGPGSPPEKTARASWCCRNGGSWSAPTHGTNGAAA